VLLIAFDLAIAKWGKATKPVLTAAVLADKNALRDRFVFIVIFYPRCLEADPAHNRSHRGAGLLSLYVLILSARVVGRTPRSSAAPPAPETFQFACSSAFSRFLF